jgi:ADP-ribose pyrophosphatase
VSEKSLTSQWVFTGKLLKVRVDEVALPTGRRATREIVEHPGAVAIVALRGEGEEEQIVLVRQFRKAVEESLLEIPAGTLEPNEEPLACAQRELLEETGFVAQRWEHLQTFYTAPGFCTEKMRLYLARDLRPAPHRPAPDEQIELGFYSRSHVKELLQAQQIRDAKTLVGLLWWLYAL